jgi:arylsulfatase A-like enzyme
VLADDATEFIRQATQRERPFFMYLAFNAPHDPRQAPRPYLDRYPLERIAVPKNFLPVYPHHEAIGCGPGLRDEQLAPFPRSQHVVKVHRREYYAMITHLDAQIGRILDALAAAGLEENTWVLFTSDHGLAVGRHGLLGKQNMYDHSLRVPLVVAGPQVPRGKTIDATVYLQDLMPTALELAGADREQVEFHSLLPLLRGQADRSPYEDIYGAYLDRQRAVIHDGWKLIVYPRAQAARLYHVARDPQELIDLADDPNHAERKQMLWQRLVRLQAQLDDTLELPTGVERQP